MQQQHYPADHSSSSSSSSSRPCLPDARPHTIHALPGSYFEPDVLDEDYPAPQEDHPTRRGSLAGHGTTSMRALYTPAPEERLSRDDTAADVCEVGWSSAGGSSSNRNASLRGQFDGDCHPLQGKRTTLNESEGFVAAYAAARPFLTDEEAALQYHRERSEAMINGFNGSLARCDAMSAQPRDKRSLGRRFSRTYKEKFSELKDSMNKRAPRMRRASTPQNVEVSTHAPSERPVNTIQAAPLSPSKRNSRYPDPRAKKF
ncbi:hypothetical protein B0A55_13394, partial [Friedmanniomyces simplex]